MVDITMSLQQKQDILEHVTEILGTVEELEKNAKSEISPLQGANLKKLNYISHRANHIIHCIPRHSIADVGWDSEDFRLRLGHVNNDPYHRVIILDYNEAENTVGCYDLKHKGIAYFAADEVSQHNEYCRT